MKGIRVGLSHARNYAYFSVDNRLACVHDYGCAVRTLYLIFENDDVWDYDPKCYLQIY